MSPATYKCFLCDKEVESGYKVIPLESKRSNAIVCDTCFEVIRGILDRLGVIG